MMADSLTQKSNHDDDADAAPTDALIEPTGANKMEMTRVDMVGNKSTSYDLLGSKAKKMEIRSEESNTFVRMYRYVPYALCLLYLVVLALVILFTFDYVKTRSDIETLRAEIKQLKSQPEHPKTPPIVAPVLNRNDDKEMFERIEKRVQDNVESLKKHDDDNNRQKEKLETAETALRNLNEKFDNLSQTVAGLQSSSLAANQALSSEVETLKSESKVLQERIASIEKKTTTLETNTTNTRDDLKEDIDRLEKKLHEKAVILQNKIDLSNSSLTYMIRDAKQAVLSELNKVTDELKSEMSGNRRKIAQIETNLQELNTSTRNLAESLAKDAETDKLAEELTKIKSNSASSGASVDDLKLLKQDVRTLTDDLAKVNAQVDDLKDLRRLETQLTSLKSDVDKHTDELSSLNRNVTSVDDDLTRQNEQIGRTNQRVESLSESLSTQSGQLDSLTGIVQKLIDIKKNKPAGS